MALARMLRPRGLALIVAAAALLAGLALPSADARAAVLETANASILGDVGGMPTDLEYTPVADDACMQELRRCCCCPAWTHYAIFDVLFLQRNNQIGNRPLVFTDAGVPVMTSQDLQPGLATGVRLFYGELFTDRLGWEIGYTGIYGMFGDAVVTGNENLQLPPDLGNVVNNFNDADKVRATYWSTLNIAEFNLFCYDCCQECRPTNCPLTNCRPNCHCINYLMGFVWAGLNEQASLTSECCNPPESASYTVNSATNYFGPQIGMRGRREWQRWAVEGWWKAAVCGTNVYQSQLPITGTITGPERGALSASDTGVGFIGSINGTVIYRLTEVWGLRAGYNFYWLTNSALAPNQWDFATNTGAGTGINDNGGLFLQGANLGVEARW
jgi:hypothetical protein